MEEKALSPQCLLLVVVKSPLASPKVCKGREICLITSLSATLLIPVMIRTHATRGITR